MKARLIYSGYVKKNLVLFIFMMLLVTVIFVKQVSAQVVRNVKCSDTHVIGKLNKTSSNKNLSVKL